MKIAVFGGTFDPFTIAHAEIVKQVASYDDIDKVIILPSIVDYHRTGKKPWLNLDHRLVVINKFVKYINSPKVIVDDMEYRLAKQHIRDGEDNSKRRYIDMLKDIRTKYYVPGVKIVTVIGTDSFINFKNWSRYTEILTLSSLIVVDGRENVYLAGDAGKAYVDLINELEHCIDRVIQFEGEVEYTAGLRKMSASAVRNSYQDASNGFEVYCEWIDKLVEDTHVSPKSSMLLTTPIFDVVKGPEVQNGFHPIQVKAPDWVAVIVDRIGVNGDRQVLLTKQLRYGTMKEYLEFPCGTVEPGEDPRDAAVRELKEETGYEVPSDKLKFLGNMPSNPAFMTNHIWVYSVTIDRDQAAGETNFDEHEQIETAWKESRTFIMDTLKTMPGLMIAAWLLYEKTRDRYILSPHNGK